MPVRQTAVVTSAGVQGVVPAFWDDACVHLSKRDRVMRKLIAGGGKACLQNRGDAFTTLARSIVGQQISVKAAQSVWERLLLQLGLPEDSSRPVVSAATVVNASPDLLRAAGLSARKVSYIKDLAIHFADQKLDPALWPDMPDEAIIEQLVDIRGIGRWTAEMFLIFHLMRANVLPLDDIGLLKAISLNYFSGEPVTRAEAREIAEAWGPYKTVGTWYLWRSLDPIPVEY
jgi:DNA-3-methyladenine glycosylase II